MSALAEESDKESHILHENTLITNTREIHPENTLHSGFVEGRQTFVTEDGTTITMTKSDMSLLPESQTHDDNIEDTVNAASALQTEPLKDKDIDGRTTTTTTHIPVSIASRPHIIKLNTHIIPKPASSSSATHKPVLQTSSSSSTTITPEHSLTVQQPGVATAIQSPSKTFQQGDFYIV